MKTFRLIMFILSSVSIVLAASFSFKFSLASAYPWPGIDGGATGFAVLAGLALIAAAITYLREENTKQV